MKKSMKNLDFTNTSTKTRGFALVVTISMLVLLSVIAMGLLSLSAISLRSDSRNQAHAEARANARLALMIAIGELQKQMGSDQRISAKAAILDTDPETIEIEGVSNPHWVGAWDSWIAGPLPDSVNENYPSAESHHQTIGSQPDESMRPEYDQKDLHFRRWLLSLNPDEAIDPAVPFSLSLAGKAMPAEGETAVRLVGQGALGESASDTDYVSARLIDINPSSPEDSRRGRYAWWVGDESQKARVMNDSYHGETLTSAEKIFRSQSPASTGTNTIPGLTAIDPADQARLESLPSLATLDLVPGVEEIDDGGSFRASQKNFHSITPFSRAVLADVREGGLKRDLSTLLERPVDPEERSDEFMLYKFDNKDEWANAPTYDLPDTPQEAVPIQDLAAFYQLYDQSRKAGIEYNSGSIQVTTPDFGTTTNYDTKFQREYTTLYRNPVVVKIQYLVSLMAEPITAADRALEENGVLRNSKIPLTDTKKLRLAVMPAITLWNPYNVPIVMETGDQAQQIVVKPPAFMFQIEKQRSDGSSFKPKRLNLNFATSGASQTQGKAEERVDLIRLNFGRLEKIPFEPGEVRVFSLPFDTSGEIINYDERHLHMENELDSNKNLVDASPGWNPNGFYTLRNSTPGVKQQLYSNNKFEQWNIFKNLLYERVSSATHDIRWSLTMAPSDELAFTIIPENTANGQNVTGKISPHGSALSFYMAQRNFSADGYKFLNLRHQSLVSRFGGGKNIVGNKSPLPLEFNRELLTQGMPGEVSPMVLEPIPVSAIAAATDAGEPRPFFQFALMAGCETSEMFNGGIVGGRKFPSRPFLHSSPLQPNVIDKLDGTAPYNHGWNWWVDEMNSVLESLVQESQTGNGFYGGGFSNENGTTHVVQQEVPVTPPVSIAALSHARIGGFTLADEAPVGHGFTGSSKMEGFNGGGTVDDPSPTLGFQRVTATGQGGLFPHVLQAIGNSYANPNLGAGVAYDPEWTRFYDVDDGEREVTFADHSYLANKALWDEFLFSSITPQPDSVEIFGASGRDAKQVASDFFFDGKLLPNRRIVPYRDNVDSSKLDALFAQKDTFTDGLADKIAAHLMVEGPFNINSTSVEAWKVFFSSLKGKPIAYLDGGSIPQEVDTGGEVPVSMGALPAGLPASTADTSDPRDPEQWKGLRFISEDEIDALAQAMVREVKKRGPFLSLSEFVNRRLDPSNTDGTALKGALQAALDYDGSDNEGPEVTINKNFRADFRKLDDEVDGIGYAFPAAAEGPAAYGSSAYVDQADVLRQFAGQLTPRGDTFVIRTYGDAMDQNGNVLARAWCEAVVQRTPDYVDPTDDNHLKTSDLESDANKRFGRAIRIVSFRWLNASEI